MQLQQARSGMSTVMTLIITVIVVVIIAGSILLIFRSQAFGGIFDFIEEADKSECLQTREVFCQQNGQGCWDSTQQRLNNKTCARILGQSGKPLYDCSTSTWNTTDQMSDRNCGYVEG